MTGPLPRPGDTSLLLLADILDNADEQHVLRREPRYEQGAFMHPCGTPACAIGHWLAAEGRSPTPTPEDYLRLQVLFQIDQRNWGDLFGGRVHNWTAQQAAERIRTFVHLRSLVKVAE